MTKLYVVYDGTVHSQKATEAEQVTDQIQQLLEIQR